MEVLVFMILNSMYRIHPYLDSFLQLYYFRRELHKFIITSVAISDDKVGHLLITGSGDGSIKIIPIRSSRPWTWIGLFLALITLTTLFLFILFCMGIIGDEDL